MLLKPLLNGGPALATSLAGVLNCVLLFKVFSDRHGDIGWRDIRASMGRIIVASLGMGGIVWITLRFASFTHHGPLYRALLLAFVLGLASGSYFLLAWLMGCEELSDIYGIAARHKKPAPTNDVG